MEGVCCHARALAIDYVDARTDPQPDVEIDLHIAASGALERHLIAKLGRQGEVRRLNHHADPLLRPVAPQTGLRLAYFGRGSNRTLPSEVRARVSEPDYDGGAVATDIHRQMMAANMHYAVREMAPATQRDLWVWIIQKDLNKRDKSIIDLLLVLLSCFWVDSRPIREA